MQTSVYNFMITCLLCIVLFSCQKKTSDTVTLTPPDLSGFQSNLEYEAEIKEWQAEEKATYIKAFNVFDEKVFTESDFAFYPIDDNYKILAHVTQTDDAEIFEMPTSGTRTPRYREFGKMTFILDGKSQELTLYENMDMKDHPDYGDYLFCPFYDETSGGATYGGGRYLDFKIPKTDKLFIDFNKCYHPYCAYLDKFNCPITPIENTLTVAVEAGMHLVGGGH